MTEPHEWTVREAGRKGGRRRADAAGPEGMAAIGKLGGKANYAKHGIEHYRAMGAAAVEVIMARYGRDHYVRIGRLGGIAKARRRQEAMA